MELHERVFCNRTLNLNSIKVFGFDMDYTLVLYREREMEELAFRGAVDYLIKVKEYPKSILKLKFDPSRVIRGLVIDQKLGNLLKINRFGYVKASLHGSHFHTREEIKEIYQNRTIHLNEARYEMVHTMFSLALTSLFCQLVQTQKSHETYETLFKDITAAVDELHRNDFIKGEIIRNPKKYVIESGAYLKTLQMLKAFGKKIVVITNSEWAFTEAMMSFSYGKTWRDLFDLVIVGASKPAFFTDRNKFFEVIPDSGLLRNVPRPIELRKVYQGGNSISVENLFKVDPSRVLYIGDHIYSDVVQSKRACQWRTMLVISELEEELISAEKGRPHLQKIQSLMEKKEGLENKINDFRKKIVMENGDAKKIKDAEGKVRGEIAQFDVALTKLIREYDGFFNPHWGELMWAGNDMSYLGMAIERYACTHTARVSNLLNYSPVHYFRPPIKSYV